MSGRPFQRGDVVRNGRGPLLLVLAPERRILGAAERIEAAFAAVDGVRVRVIDPEEHDLVLRVAAFGADA
jgi:hypothetical protein